MLACQREACGRTGQRGPSSARCQYTYSSDIEPPGCIMPRMRMLRNSTRILAVAFILSPALSGQTFTNLYSFGSANFDGEVPGFGVILGPNGELYGTTSYGGKWGDGTVFELSPPASPGDAWTEAVIYSMRPEDVDEYPTGGLLLGPKGALYGAISTPASEELGTVFRLDPPTATGTRWSYATIGQFTGANGGVPGGLAFGSPLGYGQSLYGTTQYGGQFPYGSVFRLTPPAAAGGTWTQTTLYGFPDGSAGYLPLGSLAVGAGGTLFGVAAGGTSYCGVVYSLAPPAEPGGDWTEQVLHTFVGSGPEAVEGCRPELGVVVGTGGVLYGTTSQGPQGHGGGRVFSLTPPTVPGTPMTETTLHAFTGSDGDGLTPSALLVAPNGMLYGSTVDGGTSNCGTVFELAPPASPGGNWTETILHDFTGGADGANPSGLALGPDGTLYGAAATGGIYNQGTVFSLTP
jgi:uncharacterized repeat protein (TIGR03803 family)